MKRNRDILKPHWNRIIIKFIGENTIVSSTEINRKFGSGRAIYNISSTTKQLYREGLICKKDGSLYDNASRKGKTYVTCLTEQGYEAYNWIKRQEGII